MAKVDFEYKTKYGTYSDTIFYPDDNPMTDEQIEIEKQNRLNNWISIIENPIIIDTNVENTVVEVISIADEIFNNSLNEGTVSDAGTIQG